MYAHIFLLRSAPFSDERPWEVDSFYVTKLNETMDVESFKVARQLDPSFFEKTSSVVMSMDFRSRFNADIYGPLNIKADIEMTREQLQTHIDFQTTEQIKKLIKDSSIL